MKKRIRPITEDEKKILNTLEQAFPGLTADQKKQLQAAADALLVLSQFKDCISA